MRKINEWNILGINIQIVVTIIVAILGILSLFLKQLFPFFQLAMAMDLFLLAYNNHKVYQRKKNYTYLCCVWYFINFICHVIVIRSDIVEDIVYYNDLYDLYGSLLTEKQKEYFEDYYFHNMSYAEMAEDYDVSRNAMFKQVHIVIEKLEEYEEKLHLYQKKKKLLAISNQIVDEKIRDLLENIF